MWRPAYKQRCMNCKKNMVLIQYPKQRPICVECQSKSISTPITDPKFQKLFKIDPALYEQSSFLRDIRYQYGRFENLSERQISVFQRVVHEITEQNKRLSQGPKGSKEGGLRGKSSSKDPVDQPVKPSKFRRRASNPLS